MDGSDPRFQRLTGPYWAHYVLGLMVVIGGGVFTILMVIDDLMVGAALLAVATVVSASALHPVARRIGVFAGGDGIVVQNFFRRYELPWREVIGLSFGRPPFVMNSPPVLTVVANRPDGRRRRVFVPGVIRESRGARRVVEYARNYGIQVLPSGSRRR